MNRPLFTHSTVDGHWDFFQFCTIIIDRPKKKNKKIHRVGNYDTYVATNKNRQKKLERTSIFITRLTN